MIGKKFKVEKRNLKNKAAILKTIEYIRQKKIIYSLFCNIRIVSVVVLLSTRIKHNFTNCNRRECSRTVVNIINPSLVCCLIPRHEILCDTTSVQTRLNFLFNEILRTL